MKAKFVVHLIRSKNFTSISNEDLMYTKNLGNGRFQDIYKETVKMSTYLIAFVVSDYGHTNRTEGQRVFADQESVEKGEAEYTLRTGIEVLNSLQEYLNVNYSLQKMDQIAIPDNFFSPGGMENWGLVTYKKSIIVYPHKIATTREIQATLAMVAHEFAHQWFGNLVTCSWWKYIWLNEGFANYFQSYAASIVRPKWRLIDQFLLTSLQSALESDSSKYTEPMNHGDGPRTYIYYQKAGSVVRMFEHFLTQNIFRKSLTVYLNKNAFQYVQPQDLYQALQQVVDAEGAGYLLGDLRVSSILKTWDSQAGYPVVTVTRNYKTGHVLLEQRRFFLENQPLIDNNTWYIPINYNYLTNSNHNTAADFWMTERTQTVNQSFPNSSWLIVNKQQTGYYRVNYDQTNWNRLTVFLKTNDINSIHVLNRAQLIDDSFNLARAGQLDYNIPLNLSTYLRKETDFVPLTSFLNNLNFLNVMLAVTAEYSIFQSYINDLLEGAYRYLGPNELENDEHLDKLNRINVLNWLCNVGNVECRNSSLIKLRDWKENNRNLITPNLETPVFCGALRIGNQDDWDFLYQKYEVTENTSQRIRILNALGCSENKTTLNKFLDKVLQNNSSLQADDRVLVFKAICNAGKTGLYSAIEYIDEHFLRLRTKVNLPAILEEIAAKFTTEKQLHQLVSRTNKHRESSMYDKVIQKTNENIRWSKQHIGTIKRWLVAYSKYQV